MQHVIWSTCACDESVTDATKCDVFPAAVRGLIRQLAGMAVYAQAGGQCHWRSIDDFVLQVAQLYFLEMQDDQHCLRAS